MIGAYDTLELYHVGFLVKDLEAGMARMSAVLGESFLPPRVSHVERMDDENGSNPSDVLMTFSRSGPPYVEILEATGSGVYAPELCGVHHLGYWVDEPAAALATLEQQGLRRQAVKYGTDGEILLAYFESAEPFGTRIEIVDRERSTALLSAWIEASNARQSG